jgi:[protein-PII] uridylyltransferase
LYVFERQKREGKKLDRALRRRLEAVLNEELRGRKELNAMRRSFPELLRDADNTALVVRSLHETLFLMRIIPEYDQLTCLKRYDLYHHYTADEHSFKVLEHLTALEAPDADAGDPFVRLSTEVSDKRVLYLAALLHDIGKIEGRGHARKGAVLARKIMKRMFLPEEDIEQVSFLIQNHLVMSHFSQRRDPSDIGTIEAFCKQVKDRTRLKYLCLLTYADYRATSPLVWSDWKRTLLWDLYLRAYDHLTRTEKQPEAVYKAHKRELLAAFPKGRVRAAALEHLDMLPGGYLLTMSADMVDEHMAMIASLESEDAAVTHHRRGAWLEITFCTHDKPSRLSQLCGVLTINDFNILHAHAFTRTDGKVIDVFQVEHISGSLSDDDVEDKLESIRRALDGVFAGRVDLAQETERHAARWRRARRGAARANIPVDMRVKFENDVSTDFTIIDVFAEDRPGLLYRITRALSGEGLTIFRANISTEATRAIDSFYVGDARGRKIIEADALRRIRRVLEDVV